MTKTETLLQKCTDLRCIDILLLSTEQLEAAAAVLPEKYQGWLEHAAPQLKRGEFCLKRDDSGEGEVVFFVLDDVFDDRSISALAASLPGGCYRFVPQRDFSGDDWFHVCLAWGRAAYKFDRYKSSSSKADSPRGASLCVPDQVDFDLVQNWLSAMRQAKDMINTPVEDLNPEHMEDLCVSWAAEHGADCAVIKGNELLDNNYPMIHAIGRGSDIPPCLIDMRWGHADHPKVTLVGKGVCFDTGGINLKSTKGMRFMKKDMGGAAVAFALAQMIVLQKLPVRLRLLIPAIKNSISGNCLLPGDIIKTRNGKTVEITNTDAEGRLILCDALAAACEESPDYLFDFATLTGAARVALGPELPALFCNDEGLGAQLQKISWSVNDKVWQLPLHDNYLNYMKSDIADLMNSSSVPFAGAVTAALYLQEFVSAGVKWAHYDAYCWNPKASPGFVSGGDAQTIRGIFAYLSRQIKG